MKEKKLLMIICFVIVLIIAILSLDCGILARITQAGSTENILLIDAGHGGMDSGAVSADGTYEKDINLAIAKELEKIAPDYGFRTVMTRENDEWLCTEETGSIRSRKTADLAARREMLRKYSPQLAVSIHLNSFKEDPSVYGVQVFYPGSGGDETVLEGSKRLAEAMQQTLQDELAVKKERTAMIREGVFIFKEVLCPIVIVECGFLSNPEEAALLKTAEYQQKAAQGIMAGIAEFTGFQKKENVEIIDSLK